MENEEALTADVSRVAKCSSNFWIQLDHEVTLLCNLFVTVFDLLGDKFSEAVAA